MSGGAVPSSISVFPGTKLSNGSFVGVLYTLVKSPGVTILILLLSILETEPKIFLILEPSGKIRSSPIFLASNTTPVSVLLKNGLLRLFAQL